jgi:predicted enzyme related to lactoylglutathione lyase
MSSIDDYLKKAKFGSKNVLEKMGIDKLGYYARIADSEGNVIGL